MTKVTISDKHDPRTATFWGRYPIDVGQAEANCPTVALFENPEGQFFTVEETRTAPDRSISTTREIPGTMAELIDDPRDWLRERVEFVKRNFPSR